MNDNNNQLAAPSSATRRNSKQFTIHSNRSNNASPAVALDAVTSRAVFTTPPPGIVVRLQVNAPEEEEWSGEIIHSPIVHMKTEQIKIEDEGSENGEATMEQRRHNQASDDEEEEEGMIRYRNDDTHRALSYRSTSQRDDNASPVDDYSPVISHSSLRSSPRPDPLTLTSSVDVDIYHSTLPSLPPSSRVDDHDAHTPTRDYDTHRSTAVSMPMQKFATLNWTPIVTDHVDDNNRQVTASASSSSLSSSSSSSIWSLPLPPSSSPSALPSLSPYRNVDPASLMAMYVSDDDDDDKSRFQPLSSVTSKSRVDESRTPRFEPLSSVTSKSRIDDTRTPRDQPLSSVTSKSRVDTSPQPSPTFTIITTSSSTNPSPATSHPPTARVATHRSSAAINDTPTTTTIDALTARIIPSTARSNLTHRPATPMNDIATTTTTTTDVTTATTAATTVDASTATADTSTARITTIDTIIVDPATSTDLAAMIVSTYRDRLMTMALAQTQTDVDSDEYESHTHRSQLHSAAPTAPHSARGDNDNTVTATHLFDVGIIQHTQRNNVNDNPIIILQSQSIVVTPVASMPATPRVITSRVAALTPRTPRVVTNTPRVSTNDSIKTAASTPRTSRTASVINDTGASSIDVHLSTIIDDAPLVVLITRSSETIAASSIPSTSRVPVVVESHPPPVAAYPHHDATSASSSVSVESRSQATPRKGAETARSSLSPAATTPRTVSTPRSPQMTATPMMATPMATPRATATSSSPMIATPTSYPITSNTIASPSMIVPASAAVANAISDSVVMRVNSTICGICWDPIDSDKEDYIASADQLLATPPSDCKHSFCSACWNGYIASRVLSNLVHVIRCPAANPTACSRVLSPAEVRARLQSSSAKVRYDELYAASVLARDPAIRWCPAPNCNTILRGGSHEHPKLTCAKCATSLCFICSEKWHPDLTCAAATTAALLLYLSSSTSSASSSSSSSSFFVVDLKCCPSCSSPIERAEGCNFMRCAYCQFEFCWNCMSEYDADHYEWWNIKGCPLMHLERWSCVANDECCCCCCCGIFKSKWIGKIKRSIMRVILCIIYALVFVIILPVLIVISPYLLVSYCRDGENRAHRKQIAAKNATLAKLLREERDKANKTRQTEMTSTEERKEEIRAVTDAKINNDHVVDHV